MLVTVVIFHVSCSSSDTDCSNGGSSNDGGGGGRGCSWRPHKP